jgi:hypothetical protein
MWEAAKQCDQKRKGRSGPAKPNYLPVGSRVVATNGYVKVKVPGERWVYEHRLVTQAPPGLHVHHRDGDKTNNDLANLQVLSNSEHGKLRRCHVPLNE